MTPYRFDLERSAQGLRLNRFLHGLIRPAQRALFLQQPERAMAEAGLTEAEAQMVATLDWRALMDHGASFFCLEKLGRVKGVSNPQMIAAIRGETLEAFLATRRVPEAR